MGLPSHTQTPRGATPARFLLQVPHLATCKSKYAFCDNFAHRSVANLGVLIGDLEGRPPLENLMRIQVGGRGADSSLCGECVKRLRRLRLVPWNGSHIAALSRVPDS